MNIHKKIFSITLLLIVSLIFIASSCEKEVSTTAPEVLIAHKAKIFVESKPRGAKIYIDNKNTGQYTPDTIGWLKEGSHKLTLKLKYYKDSTLNFKIGENEVISRDLDFTSNPTMFGAIYCDSNPRDAKIFIDDSATGQKTPFTFENILPGPHDLTFIKTGYWNEHLKVTVNTGSRPYVNVNLRDTLVWVDYNTNNTPIPVDYITKLAIENGSIKWIGTAGEGVVRFDDKEWKTFNTDNSPLPSNFINDIVVDKYGDKWFCTTGGLARFDGVNWTIYDSKNSPLP